MLFILWCVLKPPLVLGSRCVATVQLIYIASLFAGFCFVRGFSVGGTDFSTFRMIFKTVKTFI